MYDESLDFINRASAHPGMHQVLLIVVVNAPADASSSALGRTRQRLDELKALGNEVAQDQHASLLSVKGTYGKFNLLVMDHCSPGRELPPKEGVGRARKLGADVALELWHNNHVMSDWLYQSDADATLPSNYFNMPGAMKHCAALHLNFQHQAPGGASVAQQLYDLKLDHYVAGLAYAGSPYAHYSLGSALVIHAHAYASVRGYPRRSAGEDFYVLNKLAKTGSVVFDESRTIQLEERLSSRVPLGTGPGVKAFSESAAPLKQPAFYAADTYQALKRWLSFLDNVLVEFAEDISTRCCGMYCRFASVEPSSVEVRALDHMGLFAWAENIVAAYSSASQRKHQFATGMDALKTLQLIHSLRDLGYPCVAANEALQSLADFRSSLNPNAGLRGNRYRGLILA